MPLDDSCFLNVWEFYLQFCLKYPALLMVVNCHVGTGAFWKSSQLLTAEPSLQSLNDSSLLKWYVMGMSPFFFISRQSPQWWLVWGGGTVVRSPGCTCAWVSSLSTMSLPGLGKAELWLQLLIVLTQVNSELSPFFLLQPSKCKFWMLDHFRFLTFRIGIFSW